MNVLQLAYDHPVLAFCVIAIIVHNLCCVFKAFIRHLNIRKAGWPPAYLDADGDQVHSIPED